MTNLWTVEGVDLDQAYLNIQEGRYSEERRIQAELNTMWAAYEPYADANFRDGFARDPDARFWEMYVGARLLGAGKVLLPTSERQRSGGQPDLCVLDGDQRIWIEAIAPSEGEPGPDQVRGPIPLNEGGGFELAPKRQAQLRITSALWTKSQIIERYLTQEVIAPNDVRLIAIGVGRFGAYVSDQPPLILSSVFPIGDEFVSIDVNTGETVAQGYRPSFEISRQGPAIPQTAFLTEQFAHISGIVWSRASIGNTSDSRPLTFVHNPFATIAMERSWGIWNREFIATNDGKQWTVEDILQVN